MAILLPVAGVLVLLPYLAVLTLVALLALNFFSMGAWIAPGAICADVAVG